MLEQVDITIGFSVVMLLLSLLITVVVQAIAALLDLRGRNLVWGIMKVLHQVDPQFEQTVTKDWNEAKSTVGKKIAEAVAAHPSIKHSWLGRATAIRQDELIRILQDLAKRPPADLEATALKTLQDWAANTVPNPVALAAANAILAKIEASIPEHAADVKRVIDQVVGAGTRLEEGVSQWFNSLMDRSSDKFAQLTRVFTVIIAAVLAFGLDIDSADIFKQISGSSEIRAKLAGIADQTLKKADEVMNDVKTGKAALATFRDQHKADPIAAKLTDPLPDLATCADAQRWLTTQSDGKTPADFSDICHKEAAKTLERADDSYGALRASLDNTGLHIVSQHFPSPLTICNAWGFYMHEYSSGRQFLGVLATALLLSLGAPFWYNALRQLGSLKPAVAQKIDNDQSAAKGPTDKDKKG